MNLINRLFSSSSSIRFFRAMVLTLLSGSLFIATASDWPQWRGPERDGKWRETGIISGFDGAELQPVWSSPVGAGYSGPTVSGDRVYVTSRLDEPEQVEQIHCLDRFSGREIWKHVYPCEYQNLSYPLGPRASVSVRDGKAYAYGAMGHVHCLDAATGEVVWSKDLVEEYNANLPSWGITASPLVDDDNVYLQVGGRPNACIVALDKNTGSEQWRSLDGGASYSAPKFIEQGGQKLLLVWTAQWFAALDLESGQPVWKEKFQRARTIINVADAVIDADTGRIFLTSFYDGSYLYRLDHEKMGVELLWSRRGRSERNTDALHSIIMTPVLIDDHVYGIDSYGEFRCLELGRGDRVWSEQTLLEKSRWATAFFVQNDDLTWIFTEKGDLVLGRLTPRGFERLSTTHIIDPTTFLPRRSGNVLWSHPAFAYKHIFVRNDRELVCVDLSQ